MNSELPQPSRTERAVERAMANRGGLMASILPSIAFVIGDQLLGLMAAMIAATIMAAGAIIYRRLRGQGIGWILPISLLYVTLRGVAGVLTESDTVFFGIGLVVSAVTALVVGATAFTKYPVASFLLPLVTPYRHLTPQHPVYHRVAAQVTAAWAMAELAVTGAEWRHLNGVGGTEFLIARGFIAWPFMALVIFLLIAYTRFRLDRYEFQVAQHLEVIPTRPKNAE